MPALFARSAGAPQLAIKLTRFFLKKKKKKKNVELQNPAIVSLKSLGLDQRALAAAACTGRRFAACHPHPGCDTGGGRRFATLVTSYCLTRRCVDTGDLR